MMNSEFYKLILFTMMIFPIKAQELNLLGTLSTLQGLGWSAPASLCTSSSPYTPAFLC